MTAALLDALETHGLGLLWNAGALKALAARTALLHAHLGDPWPADFLSLLTRRLSDWIAPILLRTPDLGAIPGHELASAARALLDWPLPQELDRFAQTHFESPAGSRLSIDYTAENAPLVRCRVQEVYGVAEHPRIAQGRLPLTFSLLSPAHRPVALTSDLPGFWRGGYADMRKEMKGRYPKHDWPEDPASAGAHVGKTKKKLGSG